MLLEVAFATGGFRFSVLVYSDQVPVRRELPPEVAESGRGLHLVNSLAKSWGCDAGPANGFSKAVWAELA